METTLYQGDCLDRMKEIADGSVDMVQYGTERTIHAGA